jgi:phage FluMu gp28-like protein
MTTPSIRTIGSRLIEYESPEHHADFKEDRSFCEAQVLPQLHAQEETARSTMGTDAIKAREDDFRMWVTYLNERKYIGISC